MLNARMGPKLQAQKVSTFKIFIGNLPDGSKNQDVQRLFEPFGRVVECEVFRNNYAFVHMEDELCGLRAVKDMSGRVIQGKKLSVEQSRNGRGPNMPVMKLAIKNISRSVNPRRLRDLFTKYGLVIECEVHNGQGFVNIEATGDIRTALREMNGYMVDNQALKVEAVASSATPGSAASSPKKRAFGGSQFPQQGPSYASPAAQQNFYKDDSGPSYYAEDDYEDPNYYNEADAEPDYSPSANSRGSQFHTPPTSFYRRPSGRGGPSSFGHPPEEPLFVRRNNGPGSAAQRPPGPGRRPFFPPEEEYYEEEAPQFQRRERPTPVGRVPRFRQGDEQQPPFFPSRGRGGRGGAPPFFRGRGGGGPPPLVNEEFYEDEGMPPAHGPNPYYPGNEDRPQSSHFARNNGPPRDYYEEEMNGNGGPAFQYHHGEVQGPPLRKKINLGEAYPPPSMRPPGSFAGPPRKMLRGGMKAKMSRPFPVVPPRSNSSTNDLANKKKFAAKKSSFRGGGGGGGGVGGQPPSLMGNTRLPSLLALNAGPPRPPGGMLMPRGGPRRPAPRIPSRPVPQSVLKALPPPPKPKMNLAPRFGNLVFRPGGPRVPTVAGGTGLPNVGPRLPNVGPGPRLPAPTTGDFVAPGPCPAVAAPAAQSQGQQPEIDFTADVEIF